MEEIHCLLGTLYVEFADFLVDILHLGCWGVFSVLGGNGFIRNDNFFGPGGDYDALVNERVVLLEFAVIHELKVFVNLGVVKIRQPKLRNVIRSDVVNCIKRTALVFLKEACNDSRPFA